MLLVDGRGAAGRVEGEMRGRILVVSVVVALLAGCSSGSDDAVPPASAPVSDGTATTGPTAPSPVTSDVVAHREASCPDDVDATPPATVTCGVLTVPERWDDPDGPTIELPTAVIEPDGGARHPDPVLFLDGGPGGDGVTFASTLSEHPVARERTIVIVGQRGTPLATPSFDCPEVEQAFDDTLADELGTPEAQAVDEEALAACYERVLEDGPDLASYDTASAATDVEAARVALGYDEYDLWGISYGTRLALEVLRQSPDHLRSIVLDSVYPPEVEAYATLVPGAERAFAELAAACDEDPDCGQAHPDLEARLDALFDRLEAEPVVVSAAHPSTGEEVEVRWDGDRMAQAAFTAMYATELIPVLPQLLELFERGDFELATTTYLAYNEVAAATVAEGLYLAVECRERAPFADREALAEQRDSGPAWAVSAVEAEAGLGDCDIWAAPPADASVGDPVAGDVPMLVLAGRFDPITPPEWSERTAERQTTAWFFELPGSGHGVSLDPCADELIVEFLDDPATEPAPACLGELGPPAFVVGPVDELP